jgi:hypothetical protein
MMPWSHHGVEDAFTGIVPWWRFERTELRLLV